MQMNPSLLTQIVFIALAFAGCTALPTLESDSPEEEIVRYYEVDEGVPHCSVACVRRDGVTFAGDPHALYRVGSLTKLFMRPAFMRLHAAGRIDIDSSIVRYAPFSLPEEYGSVTLRSLLESTSGLPRDFLNPWNPVDVCTAVLCGFCGISLYGSFEDIPGFAEELRSCRSRRHVREGMPQYSNVGFALLALSVEKSMGRSLDEIFMEEVARPHHLVETAFKPSAVDVSRVTPPCAGGLPWIYPKGSVVPEHPLGPSLRGMGALFSSAADCARFFADEWPYVDSLMEEKPLSLCSDGEDRGLLRVKKLPSGRSILFRTGMIYGGTSFVSFEPSSRTILIILRNVTSWPSKDDFVFAERISAMIPERLIPDDVPCERY